MHYNYVLTSPCTACIEGDVLLFNNTKRTTREGRVEICYNNTFGTVCNDEWDELDASVVCQQLGITFDNAVPVKRGSELFGAGSNSMRIFLDNVECDGTETSLLHCHHNTIGEHNCNHSQDAGVQCEGT